MLIQGLFAPLITKALSLNQHFEEGRDSFPEFAKKVLSNFSISNFVWKSLNDDVKAELLRLGYKPETPK